MPRNLKTYIVIVGSVLGVFFTTLVPMVGATRNSSGTYSLPSGNPVTTGTTITSTWANNTLSDIGSELTNSLDRQGRGAMSGALQIASGTSSAPGLTFSSETNSGLYRSSSHDIRLQVNASLAQQWTTTGSTFPLGVTVSQATSGSAGLSSTGNGAGNGVTATGGTSAGNGILATGGASSGVGVNGVGGATNGTGVFGTGTGTGNGVRGTGGGTSGNGGLFTGGSPNGPGVVGTGTGTAAGGTFTGGATGNGITSQGGATAGTGITATGGATSSTGGAFTGGASNGIGVTATGAGTGVGAQFACGTAATGATARNAVTLTNGYLNFSGVTSPNKDVSFNNTLTPMNLVKAWANIETGTPAINNGFNVTSPAKVGNTITVDMVQDMSAINYGVLVTPNGFYAVCYGSAGSVGTITIACQDDAGASINLGGSSLYLTVMALGPQ